MTVIEFPMPAPLMSMNDRQHWRPQRIRAKAWRTASHLYSLGKGPFGPSLIEVVLPVPDKRRRDPHNYAPTLKHIVDGLVDAGLWPDDTPEFVRTLEPTLAVCPRTRMTVKVIVTPREPS